MALAAILLRFLLGYLCGLLIGPLLGHYYSKPGDVSIRGGIAGGLGSAGAFMLLTSVWMVIDLDPAHHLGQLCSVHFGSSHRGMDWTSSSC